MNSILSAEQKCAENGVKLTKRRKEVLTALLECNTALSAYELTERCNQQGEPAMPPMSVYRILEFLEEQSLVHRLSTTNKYIACSHISCDHSHYRRPQFLICNDCTRVQEVNVTPETLTAIERVAANVGFNLGDKQLEVSGTCSDCTQ